MLEPDTVVEDREQRLDAILVEILESQDRGENGDAHLWLERFPQFRQELEEFFSGQDTISTLLVEASPAPHPQFPGYTIVRELGRGGSAVVFEALQHNPPRSVALKALVGAHLLSVADRKRFEREVRTAATLDHPNILPVYESGESHGVPFFSMKLAAGGPLSRSLGRFQDDPRAAAQLVHSLARAMHFAHQRGLLHRDLKPSNILLDENGVGYVADFGLVRDESNPEALTTTRELIGTLQYLAPECTASSAQSTVAIDVYGLGCILYACLTGRAPFEGENEAAILLKVKSVLPAPPASLNPKVPRDLDAVCRMCLEKDPARRYESAADLAEDLENVLENRPTRAHPPGPVRKLSSWMRRHPVATVAASLAALFLATASVALAVHEAQLSELNKDLEKTNDELEGVVAELQDRNQELDQERQTLRAREADLRRQTHGDRLRYAATLLEGYSRDEAVKVLEDILPVERDLGGPSFTWKYLWQEAQQEFASISVPEGEAFSVEFSPDGKWFATGDQRGNLRIYDCKTFELVKHFESTMGDVRDIAFRPGRIAHVAAAGEYASPFIWHISTGTLYNEPLGNPNGSVGIEFAEHTVTTVSVGVDGIACIKPLLKRWGDPRFVRVCPEGDTVKSAAIFPDDKLVVVTTRGRDFPVFTDLDTEIQYQPWNSYAIDRVVRTQDDQLVLIGYIPFSWKVDPFNRYYEDSVQFGQTIRATASAVSAQGYVAGGSLDGIVEVFSLKSRCITRFAAHTGMVRHVAFHPNGRILASAGADGKVRFWDAARIMQRRSGWTHGTPAYAVEFYPLRPIRPVAATAERIAIKNVATGRTVGLTNTYEENCLQGVPRQLAVSADGEWTYAAMSEGPIARFDSSLRNRYFSSTWFSESFVGASGVALSPDGTTLWARHYDHHVRGYDAETGDIKADWFAGTDGSGPVSVHPGGKYLAVRGKRGYVHVFEAMTGNLFAAYSGLRYQSDAHAFSPDGRILAVVEGPKLILWDWEQKQKLRELTDGGKLFDTLAFSPDGLELATGNAEGSISLWRVTTGQKLMTLRNPTKSIGAMAFNSTGDNLAVAFNFEGCSEIRLYYASPLVGAKPFRLKPPGYPHIPSASPAQP